MNARAHVPIVVDTASVESAITVQGRVEEHATRMLVDTGSAVTIISEETWRRALPGNSQLQAVSRSVVAANGQRLQVLGTDTVKLQVGGVQLPFPVLVARGITQECLLGADFLMQHGCLVDLRSGELFIGGASVPLQASETREGKTSSCHVSFAEDFIVPPLHEVQLPVQLTGAGADSTGFRDSCEGLVEPTPGLLEKRGLLAVHSLSAVHNGQVLTRILNPAPFPVTVRKNERIGIFRPIVQTRAATDVNGTSFGP